MKEEVRPAGGTWCLHALEGSYITGRGNFGHRNTEKSRFSCKKLALGTNGHFVFCFRSCAHPPLGARGGVDDASLLSACFAC